MALFSDSEIKARVLRDLGCGVLSVELTDDHMNDALDAAKDWLLSYISIPCVKTQLIALTQGVSEYDVASDCETVSSVEFDPTSDLLSGYDFAGVPYSLGVLSQAAAAHEGGTYSNIVQEMQYREMASRVTGSETSWLWDRARKKLIVSPIGSVSKALCRYISREWSYDKLTRAQSGILVRRTKAEAMATLGGIRSKFSELPSGDGSVSMNGGDLTSGAESLKSQLDQEIQMMVEPIPLIFV